MTLNAEYPNILLTVVPDYDILVKILTVLVLNNHSLDFES